VWDEIPILFSCLRLLIKSILFTLQAYGVQSPEFVRTFSTDTPTSSRGAAPQSNVAQQYLYPVNHTHSASPSAMLQYSADQAQYYTDVYNAHAHYYPNSNSSSHNSHTHHDHTTRNHTHHKHRHTAKARPTHPEPFLSSSYVYNNHNNSLHSGSGGVGKRKRSDSEESPRIRNSVFNTRNSDSSDVATNASAGTTGGLFSDSKKPFQYNNTNNYRNGNISGSSSSTINVYSGFTLPVYNAHYSDATDTDSMVEGEGGYDAASEKG